MQRNTDNIDYGLCNTIVDDQTLLIYGDDTASNYKLITDTWYKINEYPYDTVPSSVTCYSQSDIQNLPSKFDVATPIYHSIAIISALLILYAAYRLIIYPWFRKP